LIVIMLDKMNRGHRILRIVKTLTNLLENKFSLLGYKFGLDPLLGLIPGIGDVISLILAGGIIYLSLIHISEPTRPY
jgi:hypothetical protein